MKANTKYCLQKKIINVFNIIITIHWDFLNFPSRSNFCFLNLTSAWISYITQYNTRLCNTILNYNTNVITNQRRLNLNPKILIFPFFPSIVLLKSLKKQKLTKVKSFLSFIICLSIRLLWKNVTMTSNFVLLQKCNSDFIEGNGIIRRRFLFCLARRSGERYRKYSSFFLFVISWESFWLLYRRCKV